MNKTLDKTVAAAEVWADTRVKDVYIITLSLVLSSVQPRTQFILKHSK